MKFGERGLIVGEIVFVSAKNIQGIHRLNNSPQLPLNKALHPTGLQKVKCIFNPVYI